MAMKCPSCMHKVNVLEDYDSSSGTFLCKKCGVRLETKQQTWSLLVGPVSLWVAGAVAIALAGIPWASFLVMLMGVIFELCRNRLQVVSNDKP